MVPVQNLIDSSEHALLRLLILLEAHQFLLEAEQIAKLHGVILKQVRLRAVT